MEITSFLDMQLGHELDMYLKSKRYEKPTGIQCESYEPILTGKDYIGCSPTGSGKTLAFLLPVIKSVDSSVNDLQVFIISPTYELNHQIHNQLKAMCKNLGVRTQLINGDGNLTRQIDYLKAKPHIIVGSVGRLKQLISMRKIKCHKVKTLVMDEADKLIAKNSIDSLLEFRKCLLKYTQICMFSASMDDKAISKATELLNEPVVVNLGKNMNQVSRIPNTITHYYIVCERNNRVETLRSLCAAQNPSKCMMFSNNGYELNKTFEKLSFHGFNIDSLHGNASKANRKMAVDDFASGKLQYLLSTDIAARGLHFDKVTHIININLPEEINEYLHRAGRCGRNNEKGICISLVTVNEVSKIKDLERRFKIQFTEAKLKKGTLLV